MELLLAATKSENVIFDVEVEVKVMDPCVI